jgi:undecaprenyl-diphosphatase
VSVVVFSPVIWWNATHQWVSFLFQLHHGTAAHGSSEGMSTAAVMLRPLKDLGTYVGGQAAIWTPVLFGIALVVLTQYWVRYLRPVLNRHQNSVDAGSPLSQLEIVLLWAGTLPLVLFGVAALRSHHTEANWPGFAYFPISLLIARWLSQNWAGSRLKWAHLGVRVALVGLIGVYVVAYPTVTDRILRLPIHIPHAIEDLRGWREYGRWLGDTSTWYDAPVITNRHQDSGEAAFYMPGQPEVWCVSIGTRPTAFDYFDEKPDFAKMPRVVWVGGNYDLFEKAYGYSELVRQSAIIIPGRNLREYAAFVLTRPQR